jgi:futalosine hydrolase
MTILVVTAVEAERDAAVRDLGAPTPIEFGGYDGVEVGDLHAFAVGVGPTAAAAGTATLLALGPEYELVISAGVAGGFRDRAKIGDVVISTAVVAADQGALTDDGFRTFDDLGLPGGGHYGVASDYVRGRLHGGPYRLIEGTVLTLSCMTGTEARAQELADRHPNAVAEAMEAYGVLEAVRRARGGRVAFAEIRAISNLIGRRDRSAWDLPAAFDVLAAAFATLSRTPEVS